MSSTIVNAFFILFHLVTIYSRRWVLLLYPFYQWEYRNREVIRQLINAIVRSETRIRIPIALNFNRMCVPASLILALQIFQIGSIGVRRLRGHAAEPLWPHLDLSYWSQME